MINVVLITESEKASCRRKQWIEENSDYIFKGAYSGIEAITRVDWDEIDVVHIDQSIYHWTILADLLLKIKPSMEIMFFDDDSRDSSNDAKVFLIKSMPLNSLRSDIPARKPENKRNECELRINCFKGLSIMRNDRPLVFRTQKAEEILAFLIHNEGVPVHRDLIIDSLWPEMDADKGANNLHVNIYNIRKLLDNIGLTGLIKQSKGFYYIDPADVECDAWEFNALTAKLKDQQFGSRQLMEAAGELYTGTYFGVNSYSWAVETQFKYERAFEEIQYSLYDMYIDEGLYKKAVQVMRTLIGMDSLAVDAYEKCIEAHLCLNDLRAAYKTLMDLEYKYREDLCEPLPHRLRELKKKLHSAADVQLRNAM